MDAGDEMFQGKVGVCSTSASKPKISFDWLLARQSCKKAGVGHTHEGETREASEALGKTSLGAEGDRRCHETRPAREQTTGWFDRIGALGFTEKILSSEKALSQNSYSGVHGGL